jgi:hypothetical protein
VALGHSVRLCWYGLQEAQSTMHHDNKLLHEERKSFARVPMQPMTIMSEMTHHPWWAGSVCEVTALSVQAINNVATGCKKTRQVMSLCATSMRCVKLYHAGSHTTLLKCKYSKYMLMIAPALNGITRKCITVIIALDAPWEWACKWNQLGAQYSQYILSILLTWTCLTAGG